MDWDFNVNQLKDSNCFKVSDLYKAAVSVVAKQTNKPDAQN